MYAVSFRRLLFTCLLADDGRRFLMSVLFLFRSGRKKNTSLSFSFVCVFVCCKRPVLVCFTLLCFSTPFKLPFSSIYPLLFYSPSIFFFFFRVTSRSHQVVSSETSHVHKKKKNGNRKSPSNEKRRKKKRNVIRCPNLGQRKRSCPSFQK